MMKRPLPVVMFSSLTSGLQDHHELCPWVPLTSCPNPCPWPGPLVARELCEKVVQASRARLRVQELRYRHETERGKKLRVSNGKAPVNTLVVIGSSTGGPQLLRKSSLTCRRICLLPS